mmetsp:Transcript_39213/g.54443  ORF Transcript_39213/g.54443 Transcript_39213/m.54443 type:complete len:143 (-) Transcript_39213:237-665(-)|eukprot:CAMPEP_0196582424 /NCGR_PEP_ID=MMETSP1081-20130531/38876_1 /TAXON_ID=36882 /ORGANISM="Pyramimonas amylifera, Strain CCMP720" /LENGTH=142 /DNA_ID=CAMNT_0041902979 /DNA_START=143 /DNA_END=571 /DNA_ORIENTATION=+
MKINKYVTNLAAFATGVTCMYLFFLSQPRVKGVDEKAFVLAVDFYFKDSESLEEFLTAAQAIVKHCLAKEPDTFTYEISRSDKNPLHLQFYERYSNKDDAYMNVHKSSEAFMSFRSKVQQMEKDARVSISGNSFQELGVGYV